MNQKVRLTQLDGKMPNLALMKLAHWHRGRGDDVVFTRSPHRGESEPEYDVVYGSAIFKFSQMHLMKFQLSFPGAIIGGTGTPSTVTVEEIIGEEYEHYDYTDYPEIDYSIGFTQRGCRLSCGFCVVPAKEGRPRSVNSLAGIWRGAPYPKKIHLLDNDFFGNPGWRDVIKEARDGDFRICLSQGINVRLINQEGAEALATVQYRDSKFERRRLYTAWDNMKDERIFVRGVDLLERAGIPPKHLMVYMLVGYDANETWAAIWHRFHYMVSRKIQPYPMVFQHQNKALKAFQRWVVTGLYRAVSWLDYDDPRKSPESEQAYKTAGFDLV